MSQPALTIASLLQDPRIEEACRHWLKGGRYQFQNLGSTGDQILEIERLRDTFDVILVQLGTLPQDFYADLRRRGLLLPAVVVGEVNGRTEYHEAEVHLPQDQLEQIAYSVDAAISRFLRRGLQASAADGDGGTVEGGETPESWQLPNRLQERLGFLGVFYRRDPSLFLRNLSQQERQELLGSLKRTYRDLLISYFRDQAAANQAIESFVHTAFFCDLPVTKAVEIHMNLIDGFWKQLKLEGHKNEFLQDYRLALIDVMAHLCEMYRRSVPPEPSLTSTVIAGTVAAPQSQDNAHEVI